MRKARLQGALLPCRFGNILVGPGYSGLHRRGRYRALVIAIALVASIGAAGTVAYIASMPAVAECTSPPNC
jgi:hypothetical protein